MIEDSSIKYQVSNIPAKLLVIVGPTASGKSALAIELAERLGGEIICADSRTVYKALDIGTAKPTAQEQKLVPHHLLDIVEPNQSFTAADFKQLAERAIDDIKSRNKLPILVGGSGLYIDALLFRYSFAQTGALRDRANPRHVARSVPLEKGGLREDAVIFGLDISRNILKERITRRVDTMMQQGFIEEVKKLMSTYPNSKALSAPGYKAFTEHVSGRLSVEEAKALFIKNDYQLARRQMTWFRRNQSIHWLDDPNTYIQRIESQLNKLQ